MFIQVFTNAQIIDQFLHPLTSNTFLDNSQQRKHISEFIVLLVKKEALMDPKNCILTLC